MKRKRASMKPGGNHLNAIKELSFLTGLGVLLSSCTNPRPLKGGRALTTHGPSGSIQQTLAQSDNPAQTSRQDQEIIKTRTYTLPAGTRIEQPCAPAVSYLQDSNRAPISLTLSSPVPVVEREETRARSELGASQKDTAREMGAKLANLRGITWIGVGLFVAGLASLAWPPLKAIVGSVTTRMVITFGGLALVVLPTLVIGNELLILAGVALTAGAWFLAHRHGQLRGLLNGQVTAPRPMPGQIPSDRNSNHIRTET